MRGCSLLAPWPRLFGSSWPGEAVDLVHVAAGHAEGGVVLADGVLVRRVEQAVRLPVGVVVQLDLADAEPVGAGAAGVLGDLREGLGGQLQVLVEVHESCHVILLSLRRDDAVVLAPGWCRAVRPGGAAGAAGLPGGRRG